MNVGYSSQVDERTFVGEKVWAPPLESKHLDECFNPPLPYILLFIPKSEVPGLREFSHPQHKLYTGCTSEHRRGRRRREWRWKARWRKGRRTGHASEKAWVGVGAGQRGSFLNRRRQRSDTGSTGFCGDEQAEIIRAAHSCTFSKKAKNLAKVYQISKLFSLRVRKGEEVNTDQLRWMQEYNHKWSMSFATIS